jgi:type I restriction enzyme M protein
MADKELKMGNESSGIVQKLWNYCNVLRDDGVSYGDYVEQLTYLLFLKMADEQTKPPFSKILPAEMAGKPIEMAGKPADGRQAIPKGLDWESLLKKDGDTLEKHYRHILESLGKEKGMLGIIFRKAQNRIQDPAKLKRLVMLINDETWVGLDIDVKGEIYEGLLQKNAEDIKSGSGQYFTPRSLIKAMVEVTCPRPKQTIWKQLGSNLNIQHFFLKKTDLLYFVEFYARLRQNTKMASSLF